MTKAFQLLAVLKTGSAIEVRLLRFLENRVKMIKAMMMMNRQATPRQILRKSRGPPRYSIHNIVDEKVDVFAIGVFLLEAITVLELLIQ
ncbi:BnaC07g21140D [Brassica napus]|uniref:BnaC07g21140D protein n=1 Tax=Brassica napus TaxID=3708 RepID=A0A078HCY8_BRANA|nr:BnaC07g21140D [Brassica napus]